MRTARFLAFGAALSAWGCVQPPPDDGLKVPPSNAPPKISITSHAEGEEFLEGYVVTFTAQASDVDNQVSDMVVTWYVGTEPACPSLLADVDGISTCELVLTTEDSEIAVEVVDPDGATGSASIGISVVSTQAPVASIELPLEDVAYYIDHAIFLSGQISDQEDVIEELVYGWTSDLDGDLDLGTEVGPSGVTEGEVFLTEGTHTLTLWVEDTVGKSASASTSINVRPENTPPSCEITAPESGDAGEEDALVQFRALVSDPDVSADLLTVAWSSDLAGPLGTSTPYPGTEVNLTFPYSDLSVATHAIALLVTDEVGGVCSDSIIFTVGSPPQITLTSPSPGDLFAAGDVITFSADIDPGEGSLADLTLEWSTDLMGVIGTQGPDTNGLASFTRDDLVAGEHSLTVVSTSHLGFYDIDTVAFEINTPPTQPVVSITPDPSLTTDDLILSIDTPSVDAEGEPIVYDVTWEVDGSLTSQVDTTVLASETAKNQSWQVTVVPNDGSLYGPSASASLTISNSVPVLGSVALTPTSIQTDGTFTCTPGTSSDPDGDSVTTSFVWSVSGVDPGVTTDTLDGSHFSKDDIVTCSATPNDGTDDGAPVASNAVTVDNTSPTLASVTITPDPAYAASTLTCSWSGYDDADDDSDQSTAMWTINGVSAGAGETLSGGYVYSDVVLCEVTPNDGTADGSSVSAQLVITNTAPVLGSADLSPVTAYEGDTLTCTPGTTSDDDGTTSFAYSYSWDVSGTDPSVNTSTNSLGSNHWSRDDVVTCTITPSDGTETGTAVESNSVTISNTAPELTTATVTPSNPNTEDVLTCTGSGDSDADGDVVTHTYVWMLNGLEISGQTSAELPADQHAKGNSVYCSVTPIDDVLAGVAVDSPAIIIANTAPSITDVTITSDGSDPAIAYADNTLTCAWSGFADPDASDTDQSEVTWYVGGNAVGSSTTLSGVFAYPQGVRCTVAPYDGTEYGTTISVDLNITNSPPILSGVSMSPTTAYEGDEFACTAGSVSDADGTTSFGYSYRWDVSGVNASVSSSSDTLRSNHWNRDDTVTCYVTPTDGTDSGSEVASNSVTVSNSAPILASNSVAVSPSSPSSNDDITCAHSAATDSDPTDNTSVYPAYAYAWFINGSTTADPSFTEATIQGIHTVKDYTYSCAVTPSDNTVSGATVTSSNTVLVGNTTPTIASMSLTPTQAYASSTLTCSYSGFSDADGDADQSTFAWTINGASQGSGVINNNTSTLQGLFGYGDLVSCTITPFDGQAQGNPLSDAVSILNTPPSLVTVRLNPNNVFEDSTVQCLAQSISDDDGTTSFSYTYAWYVGSSLVSTSSTLTGLHYNKGDNIFCVLTASDGTDSSNSVPSTTVQVKNSEPSIASVTITPSPVANSENLLCKHNAFSDADSDLDQTSYEWTINGTSVGEGFDPGTGGRILYGTETSEGDAIVCEATPDDGEEEGTALSDFVFVANERPSAPTVSINPANPTAGVDDLVCEITLPSNDVDGDSISYTFSWVVDGVDYEASDTGDTANWNGPGTTYWPNDTVPSADTNQGENWTCSATANDGVLDSLYTADDSVNVQ